MSIETHDHDRRMLERAARRALRGHGEAEPNPSVGCIIANADGRVVGEGRTRRPGGPHAEIELGPGDVCAPLSRARELAPTR